ncbi:glycosaminoglycan xylosylkinase homolog [Agrilus planipennis]|uniref:Glycosaminoglycan xylosylkinase homolog n=1 Tax=Agrilus planipennis TaxID=224129 RepID=A0A1W4XHD5_AGRPL|nr:glycosaminoglycan xylosylkinase homolog [Agrilus planipennis]
MFKRKQIFLLFALFTLSFLLVLIVLIKKLPSTESKVKIKVNNIEELILEEAHQLSNYFKTKRSINETAIKIFINELNKIVISKNTTEPLWNIARSWVSKTQLYNMSSIYLGDVIYALKSNKILKADIDSRGTQLKLFLTLEGNQGAIFKPKWYNKEKIIHGPVYSGKDRYNSEIVAFYLSGILQKPLVPPCSIRKISLQKDIRPVATARLKDTIIFVNETTCVYGICYYCNEKEPACEENGLLTGAIILNINTTFNIYKSPWRRTYRNRKKAPWEENEHHYCQAVQNKLPEKRILDLIEVAIFDFLIQNGDRHRYETLQDTILLVDNGKGLGNPFKDHIDILAPLYQCCRLRKSMWTTLQNLSGGRIKEYLQQMPYVYELITHHHLDAIERRLLIVYATIQYCKKRDKLKLI